MCSNNSTEVMDEQFTVKEKVLDPGCNLDSEDSDCETPNNCKLSHRNRYGVPSSLSLLHNELQTESDLENVDLPSLDATCGPQAANPKRKKSTVCNGGTLASNYPYQCEKTTSGGKEFKVYDADALTWSCRKEHTGLCYYCYKANTCPVCGTTRKRLQSHA